MADSNRLEETLTFLKALSENNNKAWFDENRKTYDDCREGFVELIQDWIDLAIQNDPELMGQTTKSAIFRINRDVRFSANKSPYKSNFSAYLSKGGKKFPGAGYYFHLDPKGSFFACGVWMPETSVLQAIRQEIDYNLADFESILSRPSFKKWFSGVEGEKLSRPPKGYEAENPAIEFIKRKSFIVSTPLSEKVLLTKKLAVTLGTLTLEAKPFADFLNQALAGSDH